MSKPILSTALECIAVAMGIAVIVLNILGALTNGIAANLIGIGVAALVIAALQRLGLQGLLLETWLQRNLCAVQRQLGLFLPQSVHGPSVRLYAK